MCIRDRYSGRYITAETEESLQKAYDIFKSEEFARYCALVGKDKAGGYVDVSTKAVKEFGCLLYTSRCV